MSNVCDLTGKRPKSGHNVSHSNRKTKRVFVPNLFKKTFIDPETGEKFTAKVSTNAIKSMTKNPRYLLELARKMRRRKEKSEIRQTKSLMRGKKN